MSFWYSYSYWLLWMGGLFVYPSDPPPQLPVHSVIYLDILEPSDLCFSAAGDHLWIVSDKGRVYKVSLTGEVLDQKRFKGHDFEGICWHQEKLWIADETYRRLITLDPDKLSVDARRQYKVSGALNEGWESICPLPDQRGLIAITEKMPVSVYTFDEQGRMAAPRKVRTLREVSGACIWKGDLWVVSDEARTVYRLSLDDYSIQGQWRIPVLNPEGIAIAPDGTLWILSDDMHRIYVFDAPI